MSVSLVRCDDRLIHGQVIVRVLKTYSINRILLIDDETAKNPTMASIYKLSVPPGVKLVVHSLDDSDDAVEEALKDNTNTLILLKNPQIALELFKRHPELPKEFNIGPMSNRKESKKATMYAYLMENEIQAIEELSNMGVRVYFRQVAEQDEIPWEKLRNSLVGGKKMKYFQVIKDLMPLLEREEQHMKQAGHLMAQSIMNGGIIQAFGSGHSYAAAIEIAGRAGGLLPAKVVMEETFGRYETIEGVGTKFCESWDLREKDCVVIISNSGRNPFIIEMASFVKSKNVPLIAVTALEVSKNSTSRHSSGKRLFELADVVLDNHSVPGDAAVEIEGLYTKVGGTSSIAADLLLNQTVVFAIEEMLANNFEPPVLMSANIDGGPEFNDNLKEKYKDLYGYRIWINK